MTTDGVLENVDGQQVLRFERRLNHPIERVWAALTDPDELIGWLGAAEVDLPAGRYTLHWQNEGGPTMAAKITELDPPRILEYEGDPHGRLRWELHPDGDTTLLTFTATGTYPADQVALALAGWHFHLDALSGFLAGTLIDWPHWPQDQWDLHYRRYIAHLG